MLSDMKPFKLAGNVYFVGTNEASSHLIDTGKGLILIDSGYERTADKIVDSMKILGFDIADVKYIIHSHGHYDHTGGTGRLLELCNARTLMHKADLKYINSSFNVDIFVKDGDTLKLGNTEIVFYETPGHTEGSISFFFDVTENGTYYRVGMFGGAGVNQLKKAYMQKHDVSHLMRGAFFSSIERLKKEKVDIMLGNHCWHNHTQMRYEQSLVSKENPFVDSMIWNKFLEKCERELERIINEDSRTEFINYAHRGASEYAPENTLLSFNLGIFMGANGIETDVQLTKDGVPVLFHDDKLMRVTGETGCIADYTFEELQSFNVKNNGFEDKIMKFEDFLKIFGFRNLTFAIELKSFGTAKAVADLIRKYRLEKKVVITSFKLEEIYAMREYAPELKCGYLTQDTSDELLCNLKNHGVEEYCPKAALATAENVRYWHRLGFNVRVWGVTDEEIMKTAYDAGVDGMTVNFPDKLKNFIWSAGIGF